MNARATLAADTERTSVMATITSLKFEVTPGTALDTVKLEVETTVAFEEFDLSTRLDYFLTYRLFGVGSGTVGLPSGPAGRATPSTPGGPLDTELDVDTLLRSFPPILIGARPDPRQTDTDSPFDPVISTGDPAARVDIFEIARTTADEDPADHDTDELQIRAELEPAFPPGWPSTTTFLSDVVRVDL
jgi:hypothetical protein